MQRRDYSNSDKWSLRGTAVTRARVSETADLFFSRVAPDKLSLCDDVTFHRGVHLAPLRTRAQLQFAIEGEYLE
jgi:hypothetical protein